MNDSGASACFSDDEYHDRVDSDENEECLDDAALPFPSAASLSHESPDSKKENQSGSAVATIPQQQLSVAIESKGQTRILSFPVSMLQLREQEMNQTALLFEIPPERWSGSRLYNLWKQQHMESCTIRPTPFCKITLRPDNDQSSIVVAQHWAHRSTVDCVQNYFLTGKLEIPAISRGYDILAAIEYFEILYQPDQCHFASYQVYKRVQQWSRYLCYRSALAAWVVAYATTKTDGTKRPNKLTLGTSNIDDGSMELGTKNLPCLGSWQPLAAGSKKSLAQIAFYMFNSRPQHQTSVAIPRNPPVDDNSTTFSTAQEEDTAHEIRTDFCAFVQEKIQLTQEIATAIHFIVKPVTVRLAEVVNVEPVSESSGSQPSTSIKHKIFNRAVLVIDFSPFLLPSEDSSQERSKSDLSAPVDEYVEEDLATGHLEKLVKQVDARNNHNVGMENVDGNETSAHKSGSPTSVAVDERTKDDSMQKLKQDFSADQITHLANVQSSERTSQAVQWIDEQLHLSDQPMASLLSSIFEDDLPDDERQATHLTYYKKRKTKPVFEFSEKLLIGNEVKVNDNLIPEAAPVVKSPAGLLQADIVAKLPASSIAIVRSGTYDQTVTSALTGPFYLDEKGNLRDVFEPGAPEDDWDEEDTRAQARRHEWIQTTLMNRGIDERVVALLQGDETSQNVNIKASNSGEDLHDDAWDWLTGLGVCDFSRSVVNSVERQFSIHGAGSFLSDKNLCPMTCAFAQKDDVSITEEGMLSKNVDSQSLSQPTSVKDRITNICAGIPAINCYTTVDTIDATKALPGSEDESHSSGDSPRDVAQYSFDQNDFKVSPSLDFTGIKDTGEKNGSTMISSPARKIGRGLKSLFRRRK